MSIVQTITRAYCSSYCLPARYQKSLNTKRLCKRNVILSHVAVIGYKARYARTGDSTLNRKKPFRLAQDPFSRKFPLTRDRLRVLARRNPLVNISRKARRRESLSEGGSSELLYEGTNQIRLIRNPTRVGAVCAASKGNVRRRSSGNTSCRGRARFPTRPRHVHGSRPNPRCHRHRQFEPRPVRLPQEKASREERLRRVLSYQGRSSRAARKRSNGSDFRVRAA